MRNNKAKNNNNYKDGRSLKKYYCKDCGKEISIYSGIYGRGLCQSCAHKGKKLSEEHKRKIGKKIKGLFVKEKNPNWNNGVTTLEISIRNLEEYINWRKQVFGRDNYTCQECGQYNGYLEAHHIKSFKEIFNEFLKEYDQFSPIEDKESLIRLAMKYKPFWEINNGKTLCKDCHKKEHKK